jgi:hypothetical protein
MLNLWKHNDIRTRGSNDYAAIVQQWTIENRVRVQGAAVKVHSTVVLSL